MFQIPIGLMALVIFAVVGVAFVFSITKLANSIRMRCPERIAIVDALERLALSGGEREAKSRAAISFLLRREYKGMNLGREERWGDVSLFLLIASLVVGILFAVLIVLS